MTCKSKANIIEGSDREIVELRFVVEFHMHSKSNKLFIQNGLS